MFCKTLRRRLIVGLFLGLVFPLAVIAQNLEKRTGEWQQFVWSNEGSWKSLGTFLVSQQNGVYLMKPVEQLREQGVTNSRGLFDVQFTESEWIFRSDWGNGQIGVFRLNKADPGMYVGWAYLEDKRLNRNLWLLVK